MGGLIDGLQGALDTVDALGEYMVSHAEIENLRSLLNGLIEDLEAEPMDRTSEASFGESWGGGYMAHHTSIAERHVREAVADLVSGLTDYREAVDNAERMAVDTDDGVAATLRARANAPIIVDQTTITDGAGCLDQPDLTDNDTCQP
jgi:hypothetical protein